MKRLVLIVGFLLLCRFVLGSEQSIILRVTTYWREEGQLRAASNGSRLCNGRCAVDPKRNPYGSKIVLGNEELIAVDTGSAVVSRKAARLSGRTAAERNAVVIDRYFETKAQALAWESSHTHFLRARIVPPEPRRMKNVITRVAEKQMTEQKSPFWGAKLADSIPSPQTAPTVSATELAFAAAISSPPLRSFCVRTLSRSNGQLACDLSAPETFAHARRVSCSLRHDRRFRDNRVAPGPNVSRHGLRADGIV